MISRPYAAARRRLSFLDKLYEINWGLVLLITIIACVGFAMLYSVAGGSLSPWADKQIIRFVIGFFLMIAVAMVDIRVWMSCAYPAYIVSLLLLVVVEVAGHTGLGAQRWIALGPVELQPSELMKISLVLALSRYLHGLSVEDISKPLRLAIPLAMIAMPAGLVAIQPNLGTTLILVADGVSLLFLAGLSWWWIMPTVTAVAAGIPTLAICRGAQELNVALGGTLIPHLDGHRHPKPDAFAHNIEWTKNGKLKSAMGAFDRVNTSHHQAVDRVARGLEVRIVGVLHHGEIHVRRRGGQLQHSVGNHGGRHPRRQYHHQRL